MDYHVWQTPELTDLYTQHVRAAIPMAKEQLAVMVRLIRTIAQSKLHFLDLGCGDGVLADTIADAFPGSSGVAFDFSPSMLSAASTRLARYGEAIMRIEGDYAIPGWERDLVDHSPFDVVVSGFSIHHQPDPIKQRIYADIKRLLVPNGIFIHIEHVAPATPWVQALFETHMVDNLTAIEVANGGKRSRQEIRTAFVNRMDGDANILAPVDVQCDWLRNLGYRDVDCFFKIYELAIFGGRH